jgi:hypothetical protein
MSGLSWRWGLLASVLLCAMCTPPPPVRPRPDSGTPADAGDAGDADGGSLAPDAGPITSPAAQWVWVPVEGSQCASGATAGLGLNRAEEGDELFIYLQGGGACWNQGSCVPSLLQYGPLCDYGTVCFVDAAGGQRPTSVYVTHPDPFPSDGGGAFPSELATVAGSAVFNRADPANPFRRASYVFIPYCTGDLHGGAADRTYSYKYGLFDPVRQYTVHFAGAANMDRYLARLAATFPGARRIWLTGSSAGGYGATLNFERVQRAFPDAEVHLLADSSPFVPTPHWETWRDTWSLQLPSGCADCDGGFPQVMEHLAASYPSRRMGLLSYDRDRVIAWFLYAPPGLQNYVDPPLGTFNQRLIELEGRYVAHPNVHYFVVPGEEHVLLGGYGVMLADGGETAPKPSRDGGTTLKEFMNAWAEGDGGWSSHR